jgi:hypothetical protein
MIAATSLTGRSAAANVGRSVKASTAGIPSAGVRRYAPIAEFGTSTNTLFTTERGDLLRAV